MLLFPRLTQLDLTAPFEVFSRLPQTAVDLAAATLDPVVSEGGLSILPTTTFADSAPCDLLFVPGGRGVDAAMLDANVIDFIRRQSVDARWITSVCTGALLLGAAGLLRGYEATTHWTAMDLLPAFGAKPIEKRVVRDRNRFTAAGVSAGIDFALSIAAELHGEAIAREIQLILEYDPQPPFDSGSPRRAGTELVEIVRKRRASNEETRRRDVAAAASQMPG